MKSIIRILLILFVTLFSTNILAQDKSMPKRGEGVDSFLRRHNRSPKKYKTAFFEINKGKFGKHNTLLAGVYYVIPPLGSTDRPSEVCEPLFGSKLKNVKIKSQELEGACFYIVGGHGGPDPGAIGHLNGHQLHEDEYAYDVALRLARSLMEKGATVRIIIQDSKDGIRDGQYLSTSKRETCMGKVIPLNQVSRLKQRADKINSLYAEDKNNYKYCRAIFLHIDSRGKGKQIDVFFYYQDGSSKSLNLAKRMRSTFDQKYKEHQPTRGFSGTVSTRNLLVMNRTNPPSVYVELGNIQHSGDQKRFIISDNRQALANWLAEGFVKDFKAR